MQQLTAQDICKLIEVLAKDNEIVKSSYVSKTISEWKEITYTIGKLSIFYTVPKTYCINIRYKSFGMQISDLNDADSIIIFIEDFYKKEILNIIHNDKDTQHRNN